MDSQSGGGLSSLVKLIERVTVQVVNFITHIIDILDFTSHIEIMQFPCACVSTGNGHHH